MKYFWSFVNTVGVITLCTTKVVLTSVTSLGLLLYRRLGKDKEATLADAYCDVIDWAIYTDSSVRYWLMGLQSRKPVPQINRTLREDADVFREEFTQAEIEASDLSQQYDDEQFRAMELELAERGRN